MSRKAGFGRPSSSLEILQNQSYGFDPAGAVGADHAGGGGFDPAG
jgi:hypothetical protein